MLDDAKLDAAIIATPNAMHAASGSGLRGPRRAHAHRKADRRNGGGRAATLGLGATCRRSAPRGPPSSLQSRHREGTGDRTGWTDRAPDRSDGSLAATEAGRLFRCRLARSTRRRRSHPDQSRARHRRPAFHLRRDCERAGHDSERRAWIRGRGHRGSRPCVSSTVLWARSRCPMRWPRHGVGR